MKVTFLKAPIGGIIGLEMITLVEPLGLECVAGGLEEHDHQCQIIDLRIDGMEKGMKRLRELSPDIVGLQCNFTTERYRALRVAKQAKQVCPARSWCWVVMTRHVIPSGLRVRCLMRLRLGTVKRSCRRW